MGLVDHQQRVGGQVIKQCGRRCSGFAPGEVARIVFDAVAVAQLHDHFQVEAGALFQPLGFYQFVVGTQVIKALLEFFLDVFDSGEQGFAGRYVVALGVEGKARHFTNHFARQGVEGTDAFDFIVKQLNANGFKVRFGRVDIYHIAAHTEGCPRKVHVIAGVLQIR